VGDAVGANEGIMECVGVGVCLGNGWLTSLLAFCILVVGDAVGAKEGIMECVGVGVCRGDGWLTSSPAF
jgi:hypothetical protein